MALNARDIDRELQRALDAEDPHDLLEALSLLDRRWDGVPFDERPEPLSLFGGLWALYVDVTVDGMWKYLAQEEGRGFELARRHCRAVGARRAGAYLQAVRRLFPGGVPKTESARRRHLDQLEQKARESGRPEPLAELDRRHADAMPDLAAAVRLWVEKHRAYVSTTIAGLAAPGRRPRREDVVAGGRRIVAALSQMADEAARSASDQRAHLKAAAREAGLLPWRRRAPTAMETFARQAAPLKRSQWALVARRYFDTQARVEKAVALAMSLDSHLANGAVVSRQEYLATREAWLRARAPVLALVRELPPQATVKGKAVGLAAGAHRAVAAAALVLHLHEWLALTPEGRRALTAVDPLFSGLLILPR